MNFWLNDILGEKETPTLCHFVEYETDGDGKKCWLTPSKENCKFCLEAQKVAALNEIAQRLTDLHDLEVEKVNRRL